MPTKKLKKRVQRPRVERKLAPQEKIAMIATALRYDSMVLDVIQDQTMTITVRLLDYADEIQIQVLK